VGLLQNLLVFLSYTQSNKLEKEIFQNLPFHFYSKDRKGKYIDSNDYQAHDIGLNKWSDILGYTDFDFSQIEYAPMLMQNDKEVILAEKAKIVIEPFLALTGNTCKGLSYKTPLYSSNTRKMIGISGISLMLDNDAIPKDPYLLSKRQKECLYLLVRGKSNKEIAKILHLSPRTVEEHVNEVKSKMSCSTKSQVIEKAFNEGMSVILQVL